MSANFRILLVEDCQADIDLVKICISKKKEKIELDVCYDGAEALEYLHKKGEYLEANSPDIILLDFNLPIVGGVEILKNLKKHSLLRVIPVIIVTGSNRECDIVKSYANYANCYLQKASDWSTFQRRFNSIIDFWRSTAILSKVH